MELMSEDIRNAWRPGSAELVTKLLESFVNETTHAPDFSHVTKSSIAFILRVHLSPVFDSDPVFNIPTSEIYWLFGNQLFLTCNSSLKSGASDEHGYGHQSPLQYGANDEHGCGHHSPL